MSFTYSKHVGNSRQTPVSQPIFGREKEMVACNAGGYTFKLDKWKQLERFLILGSAGNGYYCSEQKLTLDNAKCVTDCLVEDGPRAVSIIASISREGRAPKNDPAEFALGLAASSKNENTRQAAYEALSSVCRTPTQMFHFVDTVKGLRGWGRGLRRAISNWYKNKSPRDLAYQVSKYQSRDGWSNKDVLRLTHTKFENPLQNEVANWVVKGANDEFVSSTPHQDLFPIWAFEKAKRAASASEVAKLIQDYRLVRECIPTQFLNEKAVQEALLWDMPITALIRNLGNLTKAGVLTPMASTTNKVISDITNVDKLIKGRVHPLQILLALKTYQTGHGFRGSNTWSPVSQVVDALNDAFYLAFKAVEPTNKRFLFGIDVSGSMGCMNVAGSNLTAREAAAAMALVTASTEKQYHMTGFCHELVPLNISPRQRLDDVCRTIADLPFGSTYIALPMRYALQHKIPVDVFVVLTDNELNTGIQHPSQALEEYRQKMGIGAKMVVEAFSATSFSVADPTDAGQLDIAGLDSNVPGIIREFVLS